MVGIPLFFDLALIWGPTVASFLFSFTNWNGIGGITSENIIGTKNYESLFSRTSSSGRRSCTTWSGWVS